VREYCEGKKIAIKPFPRLPTDFVWGRRTYASDGRQTLFKEVQYKLDTVNFGVDKGCELKLESYWSSEVKRDGKARIAEKSEDGSFAISEERPADMEAVNPSKLARYTQAKVVNGVPLKCKGEFCIVDPSLVVIAQGRRPVIAAERIDEAIFGPVLITEPVSLSVGKPIDPSMFLQENIQ
jgi:hypothetical protein